MVYDVLIVGAGAAGYGCALTLASVQNTQEWAKNRRYMMLDNNDSDILKASFFNVPGLDFGIGGDTLLQKMQQQLKNFNSCALVQTCVKKIEKKENDFEVHTSDNKIFKANIVVLATGMHTFDIECDMVKVKEHNDVMKSGKICLEHTDNIIAPNLYVAGLASGAKTMFAIASGEGAKVACQIFKSWTSKSAVAHDTIKDKRL
jgi:thioredoxin reductase